MKRALLGILGLSLASIVGAQDLLLQTPQAKNVVLEEYTGYKCQYCPDGHRRANAFADGNSGKVVLVNIHAGGYAAPSSGDADYRSEYGDPLATYFGVSGYPSGIVNRHDFGGGLVTSRTAWATNGADILENISPVNMGMTTSWNETNRELAVHVEMYYTSSSPESENFLNIALLENGIVGRQVDAANGGWINGYVHNHMLRDLVTGMWGDTVATTTSGSMVTKDFIYVVSPDFDITNCEIAAYVTESKTEIYTGIAVPAINGSTAIIGTLNTNGNRSDATDLNSMTNFTSNFTSGFDTSEGFNITLTANVAWDASFVVDGTTYTGQQTVSFTADEAKDIRVNVTPTNAGIGKFILTVTSVSQPNAAAKEETFYVVSGVETLLLNNANAIGDGREGTAEDWADMYVNAFTANNLMTNVHTVNTIDYSAIAKNNTALSGVKEIYYNVGWTFPGLTPELVAELSAFLDNGGYLYISGQDIAWETFDAANSPYSTPEAIAFARDYLHIDFKSDGSGASNSFFARNEPFGTLSSDIDAYYGNDFLYPDEVKARSGASDLFFYNNSATKSGGVAFEGDYKVLYMGIGLEMVKDEAARNEIIRLTDQFFKGDITVGVLESEMSKVFGNTYPVPATDIVTIELNNIKTNSAIELFDITGKTVYKGLINVGATQTQINVSDLAAGTYMYRVVSANNTSEMKQLQVAH